MDAQAKKKLFREKLNAQKQAKQRIDSPLVRYNEHDLPVCKVCDVVIKSDSLWPAHQVSRKHHEAVEKFKATAAGLDRSKDSKTKPPKELPKPKPDLRGELHDQCGSSTAMPKNKSSTLPPNFFDNRDTKRQKKEGDFEKFGEADQHSKASITAKTQVVEPFVSESDRKRSFTAKPVQKRDSEHQVSKEVAVDLETKQEKQSLPKGFFDDKDADLRARGITPVKPDVKDEYKEFEKLIQEDLQDIDDRLEEEEIDTAEMIQEAESVDQMTYRERVELLRRKKLELKASRSDSHGKDNKPTRKESNSEDSSSDDDNNDNTIVDWRAKHW